MRLLDKVDYDEDAIKFDERPRLRQVRSIPGKKEGERMESAK